MDLSVALNCLGYLRGHAHGDRYRIGIVKKDIPGLCSYQEGEVVVFRDEMTPSDAEMQMGEYRGRKQKPSGRVTVESPLAQEDIDENRAKGSGILTIKTTVCVPRDRIEEVKVV